MVEATVRSSVVRARAHVLAQQLDEDLANHTRIDVE
jgi:hypothetical protein